MAWLRQMRDLSRRRREYVPEAQFARGLLRRRLCRPHDGAASALSAEFEGPRSSDRGAPCLLLRLFCALQDDAEEKALALPFADHKPPGALDQLVQKAGRPNRAVIHLVG